VNQGNSALLTADEEKVLIAAAQDHMSIHACHELLRKSLRRNPTIQELALVLDTDSRYARERRALLPACYHVLTILRLMTLLISFTAHEPLLVQVSCSSHGEGDPSHGDAGQ
jgi:hypothetical protein